MSGVNPFDAGAVSFLNQFAGRSYALDALVLLASSYMFRVTGILALLWWAWFRETGDRSRTREILASGMVACLFSLAIARALALSLPFRQRPLREPSLHFVLPFGESPNALMGWSSFPSDHAALYFTLATCLCFVSRPAGAAAIAWAILVMALPRIYLGLHYPTDILGGMLLGVAVAYIARLASVRRVLGGWLIRWQTRHAGAFYAALFLYTFQLATAFDPLLGLFHYIRVIGAHAVRLVAR
jgi:undecaprenyl-diphosphatase